MELTPFDVEKLHQELGDLRAEHRALDAQVDALVTTGARDQLKIARLKKEKLRLKDRILQLEETLNPDIIA
ncbi:MAG: YdcH family protein [Maricaulaceae bacterium]